MNIVCQNCGKDSGVEATKSFGRNMALAQNAGFISKILVLYTNNAEDDFIVCSKECQRVLTEQIFDKRGVTEQRKAEVGRMLEESKAKIPQMAKETAEAAGKLQTVLQQLVKKN